MRICIDVDGTIVPTRQQDQKYEDLIPFNNAVASIQQLKEQGHIIILLTARHMQTCNNNIGEIVAKQGNILIPWLNKWKIPYDELHFGKPLADIYVDDRGLPFTGNWLNTLNNIEDSLS
jgi:capsule biosynthesis phosphatase|tara:strand:+ start:121 stop:477 length:357 start_codon:yes stop_codon:yes gene_type:complete